MTPYRSILNTSLTGLLFEVAQWQTQLFRFRQFFSSILSYFYLFWYTERKFKLQCKSKLLSPDDLAIYFQKIKMYCLSKNLSKYSTFESMPWNVVRFRLPVLLHLSVCHLSVAMCTEAKRCKMVCLSRNKMGIWGQHFSWYHFHIPIPNLTSQSEASNLVV